MRQIIEVTYPQFPVLFDRANPHYIGPLGLFQWQHPRFYHWEILPPTTEASLTCSAMLPSCFMKQLMTSQYVKADLQWQKWISLLLNLAKGLRDVLISSDGGIQIMPTVLIFVSLVYMWCIFIVYIARQLILVQIPKQMLSIVTLL